MDESLGPVEHALQNSLGSAHFPQNIDVNPSQSVGHFMGDSRLRHCALDRVLDQLFVPRFSGTAIVELRNNVSGFIVGIGINARERPDSAAGSPCARALAVGRRDSLAAFHKRQDLGSRHQYGVERFHWTFSISSPLSRTPIARLEMVSRS